MKSRPKTKKHSTLRRLLWANLLAALALLTTVTVTLWSLGLLDSVIVFFF